MVGVLLHSLVGRREVGRPSCFLGWDLQAEYPCVLLASIPVRGLHATGYVPLLIPHVGIWIYLGTNLATD